VIYCQPRAVLQQLTSPRNGKTVAVGAATRVIGRARLMIPVMGRCVLDETTTDRLSSLAPKRPVRVVTRWASSCPYPAQSRSDRLSGQSRTDRKGRGSPGKKGIAQMNDMEPHSIVVGR
jgi:hypothetical protein